MRNAERKRGLSYKECGSGNAEVEMRNAEKEQGLSYKECGSGNAECGKKARAEL